VLALDSPSELQMVAVFFFSSRRRHTRFSRDWSSDVCSSDLIVYYDPNNISMSLETELEASLLEKKPMYQWSIKNQARMHVKNNDHPFESVEDSMKRWPETATAVGITLNDTNEIRVIAPHGLDDLFNLVVRKSEFFRDEAYYRERVRSKGWSTYWPKLMIT